MVERMDRNTNFFHKMENAHKRRNTMDNVKINRVSLTKEADMRERVV